MSETITVGSMQPEILTQAQGMLDLAQSYRIDCPEMRAAASEDLRQVKTLAAKLEQQRKEITAPLDTAKKRVMDLFRKPGEFLEQAETALKRACRVWDDEQDRKRREAEAAAARAADEERKRLRAEAAKAHEAGNVDTAHAITQAVQMVAPTPIAMAPAPKIAGESTRELWRAEVDDIVALARAVADGIASPECILPNMPTLNSQARALKTTFNIPGVRAVVEKVLASRAAA
jgi:hypothetical protein